jgi:hypothetical protein
MMIAQHCDIPVTIVTDFCDPALDKLTASLDHLRNLSRTRSYCDADKRLAVADQSTNGDPLAA